jgi:serralysin
VALGDLKGDGGLEVVTGPDVAPNCDPYFNVWNLSGTTQLSGNVFAFEKGFHGGVRVAVGDVDGDGRNEIVATAGPGGFAYVQVLNGQTFARETRFDAFDEKGDRGFLGGVTVATGILDASGAARIVVGADAGDGNPFSKPVLRVFDQSGKMLHDYVLAFEPGYNAGINVATTLGGGGRSKVLASPARNHSPSVAVFDSAFTLPPSTFTTTDVNFAHGVSVGG